MKLQRWKRLAIAGAAVTALLLALADIHTGIVTRQASILFLGQQQQPESLDVVTKRTYVDR